eukprot:CAMPEP_0172434650 /NCGR_PEP_ID=MMETSP1064-20121228/70744_1 /TAXON_ID=202472 /ORGANISM="Aulacoseira subarctica , Strain CCAP 1002/5" /LENGTH=516 /DNA_ID=CAMNT_0013182885 /DNA_START=224 /DNA_END=1774 /DNA_ORIENTATION=-
MSAEKQEGGPSKKIAECVHPGFFEAERHFYPKVLNAHLHPLMKMFMGLGNDRVAQRYCHLHPQTSHEKLMSLFNYSPKYFSWAGSDLFSVTNEASQRQMIVIETNSCPSGQKFFPCDDNEEHSGSGYHKLTKYTVRPLVESATEVEGGALAVVYDEDRMEATGYAAAIASEFKEIVYLATYHDGDPSPPFKFDNDGVAHVRVANTLSTKGEKWLKVRAAFRYVTERPWNRFPLVSKTKFINSIVSSISAGKNKLVAAKAYENFNQELAPFGLKLRVSDTQQRDSLMKNAVIKAPYSNASYGVSSRTSVDELKRFIETKHSYDKLIVQSLTGKSQWSSHSRSGTYYHAGTIPNKKKESFVADLRMMVGGSDKGFVPIAVYARRAKSPLLDELPPEGSADSWSMLGTNLSYKKRDGRWGTDTNRLLLMDNKDFNKLGIGLDDLIDAYVQTVLSCIAIDQMCCLLMKGDEFNWELFFSLSSDEVLMKEILVANLKTMPADAIARFSFGELKKNTMKSRL